MLAPRNGETIQHWLPVDMEATTGVGDWPVSAMGIIEIGASLVDADGHEVEYVQRFVRPIHRPCLTHFCRQPTRINQAEYPVEST